MSSRSARKRTLVVEDPPEPVAPESPELPSFKRNSAFGQGPSPIGPMQQSIKIQECTHQRGPNQGEPTGNFNLLWKAFDRNQAARLINAVGTARLDEDIKCARASLPVSHCGRPGLRARRYQHDTKMNRMKVQTYEQVCNIVEEFRPYRHFGEVDDIPDIDKLLAKEKPRIEGTWENGSLILTGASLSSQPTCLPSLPLPDRCICTCSGHTFNLKKFLKDETFFNPPFVGVKEEGKQYSYWGQFEDENLVNLRLQAMCNEWGWGLTIDGKVIY